jgi:hypothetical protein
VIGSISHLAWAGTAAYADALVAAMARVGGTFRGSVETVHGFPILQTGLTDSTVLRALLDIDNWFDSMGVSKGRDIVATRKLVYKQWFDRVVPIGRYQSWFADGARN